MRSQNCQHSSKSLFVHLTAELVRVIFPFSRLKATRAQSCVKIVLDYSRLFNFTPEEHFSLESVVDFTVSLSVQLTHKKLVADSYVKQVTKESAGNLF